MTNQTNKYEDIGKRIREARESVGMSQKELAEKLDYDSSTSVSYLEAGERKVSVVDLESIAHILGRDIQFFLGNESKPVDVRVALRSEAGLDEKDQHAILHIIEMAKNRSKNNGTS